MNHGRKTCAHLPVKTVSTGIILTGARIMVSVILDNLAAGQTTAVILHSYPTLQADDIQVALTYAAELAREGIINLPEAA